MIKNDNAVYCCSKFKIKHKNSISQFTFSEQTKPVVKKYLICAGKVYKLYVLNILNFDLVH